MSGPARTHRKIHADPDRPVFTGLPSIVVIIIIIITIVTAQIAAVALDGIATGFQLVIAGIIVIAAAAEITLIGGAKIGEVIAKTLR